MRTSRDENRSGEKVQKLDEFLKKQIENVEIGGNEPKIEELERKNRHLENEVERLKARESDSKNDQRREYESLIEEIESLKRENTKLRGDLE